MPRRNVANNRNKVKDNQLDIGSLSPRKKIVVGVQFLFVAFGATVLVPLMVGMDPATALFSAGCGTLIFHLVSKGLVPVFLGSSFAFVPPIILASQKWGMGGTLTAFIGVALVYLIVSLLVKLRGTKFLDRFFPPVVVGPTIMLIGLSLAPSAVDMAKENWLLAIIALAVAVVVMIFGRGLMKLIPIISGVLVGYIVAICLGKVDYSGILSAKWISLPQNIEHWQMPQFAWEPFLCMIPIAFCSIIEHVGDIYVIGQVVGKDFVHKPGLHRTLLGDGLAVLFGSLVGGPPVTTYSEVTGAIEITRVTNPQVLRITAITAILFSVMGKLGAFLLSIPTAILGGIMLLLFGSIAIVGIQNLMINKVDFNNSRNIVIAGIMLTTGIGGVAINSGTFTLSGVALSSLIGILLNLILPRESSGKQNQ